MTIEREPWDLRVRLWTVGRAQVNEEIIRQRVMALDVLEVKKHAWKAVATWVSRMELLGYFGRGPTFIRLVAAIERIRPELPGHGQVHKALFETWAGQDNQQLMEAAGLPKDCYHQWKMIDNLEWDENPWVGYRSMCLGCGAMREDAWSCDEKPQCVDVKYWMPDREER